MCCTFVIVVNARSVVSVWMRVGWRVVEREVKEGSDIFWLLFGESGGGAGCGEEKRRGR